MGPNNKINRDIFKKYKNLKILTPKVFTLLDTLFQNSVFIIVKIIRIFLNLLTIKPKSKKIKKKINI